MHSADNFTQITFHYLNGQTESYNIYDVPDAAITRQEVIQEVRRLFDQKWWILHLPEQTVCVNAANVTQIEFKPPLPDLHGEGVFTKAERHQVKR